MILYGFNCAGEQVPDCDLPEANTRVDSERSEAIRCGMTEAEADCWVLTAKVANTFFSLPKVHSMDDEEVAHAIHVIQEKLLARPTYRKYLKIEETNNAIR